MGRTAKALNLVSVPGHLGPAMAELTEIERQFVIAMLENGGNQKQAALIAGYGRDSTEGARRDNTAIVAGYRVSHRARVIAAMREQAEKMLQSGVMMAAAVQIELLNNSDPKVRQKAVTSTLDRGGMQIIHKQQIEVTDNRTAKELLDFIKQAAAEQGLDPRKLLGQAGVSMDIIDAEFEEHVEASNEGLEDIL